MRPNSTKSKHFFFTQLRTKHSNNKQQTTQTTMTKATVLAAILATLFVYTSLMSIINAADDDSADYWYKEYKRQDEKHQRELLQREQVSIVAPKYLRPFTNYNILIHLNNSDLPAQVDLQLIGARDSNHEQVEAKSVLVEGGETATVKFEIGDWKPLEYVLNASVVAVDRSWNFSQEVALEYLPKSLSLFIQTDKAIYKPGQKVQFRVLTLDERLHPLTLSNELNVSISDSKQNVVRQWTNLSSQRGMVTLDMQLSEDPNIGDWLIKASTRNQDHTKTITIAEYVLPTFSVDISFPKFATYNESKIVVKVKATYTYGKPVSGSVILTVQPLFRFSSPHYIQAGNPLKSAQYKAKLNDNGSADLSVDLVTDLKLKSDKFEREIEFFALVEEDLTGRKYNKTKSMKIFDKPVKIEHIRASYNFKPGLDYTLLLKVATQDDVPVPDNGPDLILSYGFGNERDSYLMLQPIRGIVEHTIKTPNKIESQWSPGLYQPHSISLEAAYNGQIYPLNSVSAFRSPSATFLQISLPQLTAPRTRAGRLNQQSSSRLHQLDSQQAAKTRVNVNDKLEVKLLATEPLNRVTCHGIARGEIAWAVNVDGKNKTEAQFEIQVDQKLEPEARILCFYIRDDGSKELVADSISFPVSGIAKNNVKVAANTHLAKPGQEVELSVLTKPNALVGVLGVDQSVLLLKSGNDITPQDVARELKSHDEPGKKRRSRNRYYDDYGDDNEESENDSNDDKSLSDDVWAGLANGWRTRGSTAANVFEDASVVLLTNNRVEGQLWMRSWGINPKNKMTHIVAMSSSRGASFHPVSAQLASSNAFHESSNQKEGGEKEPLVIREKFPETWLWDNATASADGIVHFSAKLPDTITSWIVSAVSLDEATGLGVTAPNSRAEIRVFKPFFIKLNLPYSIIRGETVNIQAVVFNYMKKSVDAKVTLENRDNEFEFTNAANSIYDETHSASKRETKSVRINAEGTASVSFLITARKVGHIELKVIATSESVGDALIEKLLVKAEGQTQRLNKALLISLDSDSGESSSTKTVTKNVTIEVPANAVEGSRRVSVAAMGDLMGAGLSHVDDLLRLPYGCGEQNMINLVPNIQLHEYLKSTNRLRDNQRNKAIKNIETGYQRQLSYKRSDGSFSAFGESDKTGSVWLTAYVVKTLQQASSIISIDDKVIAKAAQFIAANTNSDGSVNEVGLLHNKALQSEAAAHPTVNNSNTYLTAYSMIALLQRPVPRPADIELTKSIDTILDKGLSYLESRIDAAASAADAYELAIITYALTLAKRPTADAAYDKLKSRAHESNGKVWWLSRKAMNETAKTKNNKPLDAERESEAPKATTEPPPPPLKPLTVTSKQSAHLFVPDSLSIEMTSFALLAAVKRNELESALPIVNWLISQQNANGGFASTQDTVLAFEALASFASASYKSKDGQSIVIDLLYPRSNSLASGAASTASFRHLVKNQINQMLVSSSNSLVYQQTHLPDNTSWVQVKATGAGTAVVYVSWQYNLMVSAEKPAFYLNPQVDRASTSDYLQLSVCTSYKNSDQSNMAVMEAELPSGYVADVEALDSLKRQKEIKRIDREDSDTKVIIYFDKISKDEICITIPAYRTSKVSNNKPVPVSVYDYYDRQQAARIFYEPPTSTSCDICESSDCGSWCKTKKTRREASDDTHLTVPLADLLESISTHPTPKSAAGSSQMHGHFVTLIILIGSIFVLFI